MRTTTDTAATRPALSGLGVECSRLWLGGLLSSEIAGITRTGYELHGLLFVIETRRMDGKKFPSKTIDCLLAGLLRYMRGENPAAVNFLDEKNTDF